MTKHGGGGRRHRRQAGVSSDVVGGVPMMQERLGAARQVCFHLCSSLVASPGEPIMRMLARCLSRLTSVSLLYSFFLSFYRVLS